MAEEKPFDPMEYFQSSSTSRGVSKRKDAPSRGKGKGKGYLLACMSEIQAQEASSAPPKPKVRTDLRFLAGSPSPLAGSPSPEGLPPVQAAEYFRIRLDKLLDYQVEEDQTSLMVVAQAGKKRTAVTHVQYGRHFKISNYIGRHEEKGQLVTRDDVVGQMLEKAAKADQTLSIRAAKGRSGIFLYEPPLYTCPLCG